MNSKEPNERQSNARVTGKGNQHFSVNGVHPPQHTNTGWNISSTLQFGEIPSVTSGNFDPNAEK
jgi:hypothetical protein